ncbi:MAG TPA: ACT domain-containing protein [Candidatus Thermoplasmatota archaeon]|nr:ACT domain-containing protein [Candidatus Thermoplasmatota archaeon]
MVKQLVVLVENRPGALHDLASVLAENDLNVEAIMIEGSLDFGTARIHVGNPRKAQKVLEDAGYQVTSGDVLTLKLANKPGELERVTGALKRAKVNIECLFGTTSGAGEAELVVKVNDLEKARAALGL